MSGAARKSVFTPGHLPGCRPSDPVLSLGSWPQFPVRRGAGGEGSRSAGLGGGEGAAVRGSDWLSGRPLPGRAPPAQASAARTSKPVPALRPGRAGAGPAPYPAAEPRAGADGTGILSLQPPEPREAGPGRAAASSRLPRLGSRAHTRAGAPGQDLPGAMRSGTDNPRLPAETSPASRLAAAAAAA